MYLNAIEIMGDKLFESHFFIFTEYALTDNS